MHVDDFLSLFIAIASYVDISTYPSSHKLCEFLEKGEKEKAADVLRELSKEKPLMRETIIEYGIYHFLQDLMKVNSVIPKND